MVLLVVVATLWGWYAQNTERLTDLEPVIGRLRGFTANVDTLETNTRQARAQLTEYTYSGDRDTASTGARVQQQLRGYLEQAGLNVSGSQVLEAETLNGFEEIRVDVSAFGSVDALDQALLALQTARPLLLVESLELSPAGNRRGNDNRQRLIIRMSLSALRLQP